jgi:hypothetical protein
LPIERPFFGKSARSSVKSGGEKKLRFIQDNHSLRYDFSADSGAYLELEQRAHCSGFGGRELDLAPWADRAEELHLPDSGEMIYPARLTGGDSGGLGSGLGQDDSRDQRIAWKMAAKEGLRGGEAPGANGGLARIERYHRIDEDERLPMRQAAPDGLERLHFCVNR